MSSKSFLNSSFAVRTGLLLGKVMSLKTGHRVARKIGAWLANHPNNKMVQAVWGNQYMVGEGNLSAAELRERTARVFQSVAISLFDYYYYIRRPEKLKDIIFLSPEADAAFKRDENSQSAILVIPHMSNFDLMGHALALYGIKVQILSFPAPTDAYKMQNKLRQEVGVVVTPMSFSAFREAKNRLKAGGYVVTGLDRPLTGDEKEKYRPKFFGQEANLPVIHVRLAKETQASIYVMACIAQPDGTYLLQCSKPYNIEPMNDLQIETIVNAERLLNEAENFIRQAPEQWAMFFPVWPDAQTKAMDLLKKDSYGKKS